MSIAMGDGVGRAQVVVPTQSDCNNSLEIK